MIEYHSMSQMRLYLNLIKLKLITFVVIGFLIYNGYRYEKETTI